MLRLALALTLLAALGGAVAVSAYARQHAAFHHMRYCVAPDHTFPMHPCADDEDQDEVIQA